MNFIKIIIVKLKKLIYIIIHPKVYSQSLVVQSKKNKYNELCAKNQSINYQLAKDFNFLLYPKGQIAELLYTVDFEKEQLLLVKNFIKPGMSVIDIGANIGLYSVIIDKLIQSQGEIFAFEPSKEIFNLLKNNLKLNKCNQVKPFPIALGEADNQTLNLVLEKGYGDGFRYINNKLQVNNQEIKETEEVQMMTLDTFMEKQNKTKIDFIKIDVEGYECQVLKGAEQILSVNKNTIVLYENSEIGLKRAGHSQAELSNYLKKLGFKLLSWDTCRQQWNSNEQYVNMNGNTWATRNISNLPKLNNK